MGAYKLLEVKALIMQLILTFNLNKYILNVAPQTIIPYYFFILFYRYLSS